MSAGGELHLVRHTRLAGGAGLCYGHAEMPLAETFADEAAAVRARLGDRAPAEVWSSPSGRCLRLAEALSAAAPRTDERLRELCFGAWEGRAWESFRGPESEAWALDPWRLAPPGGESGEMLWRRVGEMRRLLRERRAGLGGPLVVVTHAGVIRAWLAMERGLDWRQSLEVPVPFGEVLRVEGGGSQRVFP